jgi:hypothetical protein
MGLDHYQARYETSTSKEGDSFDAVGGRGGLSAEKATPSSDPVKSPGVIVPALCCSPEQFGMLAE